MLYKQIAATSVTMHVLLRCTLSSTAKRRALEFHSFLPHKRYAIAECFKLAKETQTGLNVRKP